MSRAETYGSSSVTIACPAWVAGSSSRARGTAYCRAPGLRAWQECSGGGGAQPYEESLTFPDSSTIKYWRGDGSAWTFTYNSGMSAYLLTSPPDERAQVVSNPVTGGFTLTLADGTQRLFNAQDLLSSIVDRNANQAVLTYDGSNRLTQVTDAAGRTLTFTYGNSNLPNLATSAQDSVGAVATYGY